MAKKPKPKAATARTSPAPLAPRTTSRFDRDVERLKRRGLDLERFKAVIVALCSRDPLPASFRDHGLQGVWKSCRDCHVADDWIIIYERDESVLTLHRTGTHADLFE